MNKYKTIREWIAEDVNPVGYVSKTKLTVKSILLDETQTTVTLVDTSDENCIVHLDIGTTLPVAPPTPKRLNNEELLEHYGTTSARLACDCEQTDPYERIVETHNNLRSQILERMKYKGPKRKDVEDKLNRLLIGMVLNARTLEKHEELIENLLSMFPDE